MLKLQLDRPVSVFRPELRLIFISRPVSVFRPELRFIFISRSVSIAQPRLQRRRRVSTARPGLRRHRHVSIAQPELRQRRHFSIAQLWMQKLCLAVFIFGPGLQQLLSVSIYYSLTELLIIFLSRPFLLLFFHQAFQLLSTSPDNLSIFPILLALLKVLFCYFMS